MRSQQVLYIRTDPELVRHLDRLVDQEREERRGHRVSRSDVARRLLWEGVKAAGHVRRDSSGPFVIEAEYGNE